MSGGLIFGAFYTSMGWVWCYWYIQRFFDRLAKEYPTHPRHRIGRSEMPLFVLASLPIWPFVALGIALIDPLIDEPVGTKTRPGA